MACSKLDTSELARDFLECPICIDTFDDPRALDCLHSFCSSCLQIYYSSASVSRNFIKCPVCSSSTKIPQNGVRGLKKNHFLKKLKETCGCETQSPDVISNAESHKLQKPQHPHHAQGKSAGTKEKMVGDEQITILLQQQQLKEKEERENAFTKELEELNSKVNELKLKLEKQEEAEKGKKQTGNNIVKDYDAEDYYDYFDDVRDELNEVPDDIYDDQLYWNEEQPDLWDYDGYDDYCHEYDDAYDGYDDF